MNMSADREKLEEEVDEVMEMAPKNNYDNSNSSASAGVEEADLQEMADVNSSLDELSTALDCFEERTDNILQQLRELLDSNREIRHELEMQKAAATASGDGEAAELDAAEVGPAAGTCVVQRQREALSTMKNVADAAGDAME